MIWTDMDADILSSKTLEDASALPILPYSLIRWTGIAQAGVGAGLYCSSTGWRTEGIQYFSNILLD